MVKLKGNPLGIVWRTGRETAEKLGISTMRVSQLARSGRFGPNAYKKFSAELNYNGVWMIPFPNEYRKKRVGRPSKANAHFIEL